MATSSYYPSQIYPPSGRKLKQNSPARKLIYNDLSHLRLGKNRDVTTQTIHKARKKIQPELLIAVSDPTRLLAIPKATSFLNQQLSQPTLTIETALNPQIHYDVTKECLLVMKNIGVSTSVFFFGVG